MTEFNLREYQTVVLGALLQHVVGTRLVGDAGKEGR